MNLTDAQRLAIQARGNVLVVAGAGAGKTSTLVERCLDMLARERCDLTEILMVTFTNAAAAEMRSRLRAELQQRAYALADVAAAEHLRRQLALLDTAPIGTLHSFCHKLVRQHFHQLALDPSVAVLDEKQTAPLITKALDCVLRQHYENDTPDAKATRELIAHLGQGLDEKIRGLVLALHRYTQSLAHPEGWLRRQEELYRQEEPTAWRERFADAFPAWCRQWQEVLAPHAAIPALAQCARLLEDVDEGRARPPGAPFYEGRARPPGAPIWRERAEGAPGGSSGAPGGRALPSATGIEGAVAVLNALHAALEDKRNWPRGAKTALEAVRKPFRADLEFLRSALTTEDGSDPLAQDWQWVRPHLCALLRLTREFAALYRREKREQGGLDFADLEQFALRLLRDPDTGEPSSVARQWQQRLRFIFVDEYQDINPAQDAILTSLSRAGADPNRFLVGDVKQSIYRFRRASPQIFRDYEARWRRGEEGGHRLPLAENFRSREALLHFVNPLFAALMRASFGGVDYPEDAHLRFGAPLERRHLSLAAPPLGPTQLDTSRVELHLIDQADDSGGGDLEGEDRPETQPETPPEGQDLLDLLAVEREARLVAGRLRELREQNHLVWDLEEQVFRPVEWRDMVVLLRAPAQRVEAFAREFHRQRVPLAAARAGFFQSLEVGDLINLLKVLDNPLQDLPLLGVLRSPLVALSLDDLAQVRARSADKPFWRALQKFPHGSSSPGEKLALFLRHFERWRELARQGSLSDCLEAVLVETHYEALLLAEPRGEERVANVRRLLALAREFDPYQRQGLYRFLRFVKVQEEEELEQEPAAVQTENAVRLMSIHKAKGLEFPVVVLAGLGVKFNFQDLQRDLLLHEAYGLCPQVKPPGSDQWYPSLIYWLAGKEERRELLGEELRLLYVALTRARDTLILTGTGQNLRSLSPAHAQAERAVPAGRDSPGPATSPIADHDLQRGRSVLDWLRLWLPRATTDQDWTSERTGKTALFNWRLYAANDAQLALPEKAGQDAPGAADLEGELDELGLFKLRERLQWQYPQAAAAREPAVKRVSELVRGGAAGEEAQSLFPESSLAALKPVARAAARTSLLAAAETGSAHHRFLELVSLRHVSRLDDLKAQAKDLRASGWLTGPELNALDLEGILDFWTSETGRKILAQLPCVQREIPFTARFTPDDLAALGLCPNARDLAGEYFVARGKADLAVLLPREIWLLDFKTDRLNGPALTESIQRYSRQLKLYAMGLGRIYRRPVTACWLHFLSLRQTVAV